MNDGIAGNLTFATDSNAPIPAGRLSTKRALKTRVQSKPFASGTKSFRASKACASFFAQASSRLVPR
ncbi:MAG: hypothetical protein P4L96_12535 [Rhodoferax sp.]|nr:hypothetical protein [Rhodoferax sp.]